MNALPKGSPEPQDNYKGPGEGFEGIRYQIGTSTIKSPTWEAVAQGGNPYSKPICARLTLAGAHQDEDLSFWKSSLWSVETSI